MGCAPVKNSTNVENYLKMIAAEIPSFVNSLRDSPLRIFFLDRAVGLSNMAVFHGWRRVKIF
jgi:hypothetical protein